MCGDSDRAYVFDGQRYSQLIDSVGDLLELNGVSCRTVAKGFSELTGTLAYRAPASINHALLRIVLGQRMRAWLRGADAALRWRQARESELWKSILTHCGAVVVLGIQPDTGLCRAGHDLGVHVFDVQHGVISDSDDNPYYRSATITTKPRADLPTGYLTWDEPSAEVLIPVAAKKDISVRIVGNPWFARFASPRKGDALVDEARSFWTASCSGLPSLVVTLQADLTEFAPDYVPNGVMAECLVQVIRETCNDYAWHLRLHPSQLRGPQSASVQEFLKRQFGGCENVEWKRASEAPLPLVLAEADAHITHYSAVTIEAAWMGLRTGLLDPHIRPGGKHDSLFTNERRQQFACCLPLEATAIKHFIRSARRSDMSCSIKHTDKIGDYVALVRQAIESGRGSRVRVAV